MAGMVECCVDSMDVLGWIRGRRLLSCWLEDSAMGRWLVRLFRDLQTLKKFRGMRSRPWQQDQTAGLRGG
jgi:hypothetical protein